MLDHVIGGLAREGGRRLFRGLDLGTQPPGTRAIPDLAWPEPRAGAPPAPTGGDATLSIEEIPSTPPGGWTDREVYKRVAEHGARREQLGEARGWDRAATAAQVKRLADAVQTESGGMSWWERLTWLGVGAGVVVGARSVWPWGRSLSDTSPGRAGVARPRRCPRGFVLDVSTAECVEVGNRAVRAPEGRWEDRCGDGTVSDRELGKCVVRTDDSRPGLAGLGGPPSRRRRSPEARSRSNGVCSLHPAIRRRSVFGMR